MLKDRPNKIPMPRTIARHYSQGRYCDYPADILLEAVNSNDLTYDPTAIPVRLGFQQVLAANFEAFVYLCEHRNPEELNSFIKEPDGFMSDAGIKCGVPFDEYAPKIFAAMVEDDMLEALRSPDDMAVCNLVRSDDSNAWPYRHSERYPRAYMTHNCFWMLDGIRTDLYMCDFEKYGFSQDFSVDVLFIVSHFSEKV